MYAPGMNCGWRKTLQANETDLFGEEGESGRRMALVKLEINLNLAIQAGNQVNFLLNKTQPEACISIYVWYNLSQEQQDM
jgi:hypothetical protein